MKILSINEGRGEEGEGKEKKGRKEGRGAKWAGWQGVSGRKGRGGGWRDGEREEGVTEFIKFLRDFDRRLTVISKAVNL